MNIEHYIRIGRLLAELHGDETLSEQQCAKIMGVDLVSWRIIEHTFSRGSWGETVDESGPTSEEAIRAALPAHSAPAVDGARDEREAFEADYAKVWNAAMTENGWSGDHTADDVKDLRDGNTYGEGRDYLNARWEGWQARAALSAECDDAETTELVNRWPWEASQSVGQQATGYAQIAEVCQDADGFKHIAAVIEDLDDIPAGTKLYTRAALSAKSEAAAEPVHSDDIAVDAFSAAMKEKLAKARAKGRGGWETCNPADLSKMLREHVEKGDPRDVANFCMMLWHSHAPITSASEAVAAESGARKGLREIHKAWQESGDGLPALMRDIYEQGFLDGRIPEKETSGVWPVPLTLDHGHVLAHSVELQFEDEEDADQFFAMYSAAMGNTAPPAASGQKLTDEQIALIYCQIKPFDATAFARALLRASDSATASDKEGA